MNTHSKLLEFTNKHIS